MNTEGERAATHHVSVPLLAAWLVAATLALLLILVGWRYYSLRQQIDQACSQDSVVARLDLTEWVPLCR